MAKDKVVVRLDNGTQIETTKEGWTKTKVADCVVLTAGWAEGTAPHHSIGTTMAKAIADTLPEFVLGSFEGIPVLDASAIFEDMHQLWCKEKGIDLTKISVAQSRNGAKKENVALSSAISGISESAKAEVLAILEKTNPALFNKLSKNL